MRDLLLEIIGQHAELGLAPVDALSEELDPDSLAGAIIALERDDERVHQLLQRLGPKPAVLLAPLGGDGLRSLEQVQARMSKPFNVAELVACLGSTLAREQPAEGGALEPQETEKAGPCLARA